MQRRTSDLIIWMLIGAGLVYIMAYISSAYWKPVVRLIQNAKPSITNPFVRNPLVTNPLVTNPYQGEQRFPVVRKPANPLPAFKTGVYLKFNTTKYTDMDGRIFIPSDAVINELTFPEVEELYYRYIENIQATCPRARHIGDDNDGGYVVCEPLLPKECLAYSFGSFTDYTFDDGLAAHYDCEVHTFDPSDGQTDHQHGELVTFHKFGIGAKDEVVNNLNIKTLDSTRTLLGHGERPLDLLKIDTEGAEWVSFPQILEAKTLEKAHVKLLIVEFHIRFTKRDRDAYMTGLRVLRGIYEAGFRIYYFRIWTFYCTETNPETNKTRGLCHEVHFLRT